ncbi:MAG: transcription antitermination factor NusB [Phycisphaerales bacterium]
MNDVHISSRRAAWEVLNQFDVKKQNANPLIEKISKKTDNRAALVDIALGVIRNSIFIDNLIAVCSGRAIKNIQPKILNCLRIAVYEIIFTEQAQYAIVNEAVELTKKAISKKSSGFTNAILRKVIGSIKNKNADLSIADSKKTLPINDSIGCEFNIDILADEKNQQSEYLSGAFSLPKWFVEEIIDQFGYHKAKNICFASNRRPSIYARVNLLKTSAQELVDILKMQQVDCELTENKKMVKLNKSGNIAELESFKAGLFTIQDLTAYNVGAILNPQAGWKIFDICSAPGTKTTEIAEMMGDKGVIIATDKDDTRLQKVFENVSRLKLNCIKILTYDDFLKQAKQFENVEAVLIDVPCSNTGVLARRPEVRFRLNKKQVEQIAQTQLEILKLAASFINKGGKICYSTCSILKQENSCVVAQFLAQEKEFKLIVEKIFLPQVGNFDCDGGYAAVLEKI